MNKDEERAVISIFKEVRRAIRAKTTDHKERHAYLDQLYSILSGKAKKEDKIDPFIPDLMNIVSNGLDKISIGFPEGQSDFQRNLYMRQFTHRLETWILRESCRHRTKIISLALGLTAAAVGTTVAIVKVSQDKPD